MTQYLRRILIAFLCSYAAVVSATNYYVSTSGNDSANGLSELSPWRSIAKVNSAFSNFRPGDKILFKRGDVFYGKLIVNSSGQSGNPITISSYGNGEAPVITGFATISGWTSEGSGIYSATVTCESSPNMVTVNGVNTPIGRYPDKGWLSIDSFVGNSSITDAELSASPDWDGAEVVIRKNHWIIDRNLINNHTNQTIVYTSSSSYPAISGYGYFIQNHLSTLTSQGEWFYKAGKLYMYFGNNNPSNFSVKISAIDKVADLLYKDYITFDNITFEGANKATISISASTHITIQNCKIQFSGNHAIDGMKNMKTGSSGSEYLSILNNTISETQNIAIGLAGEFNYATISGNAIYNTAIIPGMSESGDGKGFGINLQYGSNNTIEKNILKNVGYVPINFEGNYAKVKNNYIDTYCFIKDDGGGIYTVRSEWKGREITGNIITNGIGAPGGTNTPEGSAVGIYLDDRATDVLVRDNSVFNVVLSGIYLHNAHENTITYNTVYNCNYAQLLMVHDGIAPNDPIRNTRIENNIFFSNSKNQLCLLFATPHDNDDLTAFGTANYNYYARPLDDNQTIRTQTNAWSGPVSNRTLSSWQSYTNQDANSKKSPISITDPNKVRFEYNASSSNKEIILDAGYIDIKGTKFSGSITLLPFSSVILLPDPNQAAPPAVPAITGATIENSSPSIIELIFNSSLASIVPQPNSFTAYVNSRERAVSSVSVSGNKVLLTLSAQVIQGDIVSLNYIKPASNPLQGTAGGQILSFSAQPVTNKVITPVPVVTGSSVENSYPQNVEIVFNLPLANIIPAASAFNVSVNSTARVVSSVSISGLKVTLTLSGPVKYGETVTVAYSKPSLNPLQGTAGGQASSFSSQTVTNKLSAPEIPYLTAAVVENSAPTVIELSFSLPLANLTPAASAFTVRVNNSIRNAIAVSINGSKVLLTLPNGIIAEDALTVAYTKPSVNALRTAAGGSAASFSAQTVTNKVQPNGPLYLSAVIENAAPNVIEVTYSEVLNPAAPGVTAFSVQVNGIITNVTSVTINGKKVILTLQNPVKYGDLVTVSYTRPSGNPLQKASGGAAVSIGPQPVVNNIRKPVTEFSNNGIVTVYPNPASSYIMVHLRDKSENQHLVKIFDFTGRLCLESMIDPLANELNIPIRLRPGIYVVHVILGSITLFTTKLIVSAR